MDSSYIVNNNNGGDDNNNKNNKNDKKNTLLKILIIILLIIIALLLVRSCVKSGGLDTPKGLIMDDSANEIKPGMSDDEIREILNNKVKEGMINISMNLQPVFENGTAKGNLKIVNESINNYPQIVYIQLADTGEEIYRSGGIPVGSQIEEAALSVDLDAGTYDCVAYFNNVNPETGDILGTAAANVTITVLN